MTVKEKARYIVCARLGMGDYRRTNEVMTAVGKLSDNEVNTEFAELKANHITQLNASKDAIQQQIDEINV